MLRLDFLMALKLHKVPAYPSRQTGKKLWERNTEADIRQTCVLSFPSLLSADNSAIDTLASSASLQPLCLAKLVSGSFLFCRCLVCQLLPGLCSLILCLTIESEIPPFIIQCLINSNRQWCYKLMQCNKERMHVQKEPTHNLKNQALVMFLSAVKLSILTRHTHTQMNDWDKVAEKWWIDILLVASSCPMRYCRFNTVDLNYN